MHPDVLDCAGPGRKANIIGRLSELVELKRDENSSLVKTRSSVKTFSSAKMCQKGRCPRPSLRFMLCLLLCPSFAVASQPLACVIVCAHTCVIVRPCVPILKKKIGVEGLFYRLKLLGLARQ